MMPLEALDARAYMRLRIPLMEWMGVSITGAPRYVASRSYVDDFDRVTIGEHSVISRDVVLLTHDYSITNVMRSTGVAIEGGDVAQLGSITIGANVFIGWGAMLLPGTVLEDDVVVGAGSVVRGHVDAGTIVVGNPARPISTTDEHYRRLRPVTDDSKRFRRDG